MTEQNDNLAWLRRPDETDKAYQSFLTYLHLDPPRSLDKAKAATGKSIQTMRYLSAKFKWIERAKLYDKYLQQSVADATVQDLIAIQEQISAKALEDGSKLREVWEGLVERLNNAIDTADDRTDLRKLALAINTMVTARDTIDNMIRRAARMPGSYRAETIEEEEFPGEYMIQMGGPPILLDKGEDGEN